MIASGKLLYTASNSGRLTPSCMGSPVLGYIVEWLARAFASVAPLCTAWSGARQSCSLVCKQVGGMRREPEPCFDVSMFGSCGSFRLYSAMIFGGMGVMLTGLLSAVPALCAAISARNRDDSTVVVNTCTIMER